MPTDNPIYLNIFQLMTQMVEIFCVKDNKEEYLINENKRFVVYRQNVQ